MKNLTIHFYTISGWLAVPYSEYHKLRDANSEVDEDFLYCELKALADARNDFKGTDNQFIKSMSALKYKKDMIEFINTHYAIRQFYIKTLLDK